MRRRVERGCLLLLLVAAQAASAAAIPRVEHAPGEPPVVYLEGAPYDLGYQHGSMLRQEVRASVGQTLDYFRGRLRVPVLGPFLVNRWLDWGYAQMAPFISPAYAEEMRGLADGSGVPLREIHRLHAIPDLTGTGCSSLAVFGRATTDGRLYHTRNLDWDIAAGIQAHAALFVVRPQGGQPFLNIGYAGFIGVLSGINARALSVGEIGAATVDETFQGEPMPFVLRRVLEQSHTLEEAARLVLIAARTRGYNYVFADGLAREAIALETTHSACLRFAPDDAREHHTPYALPLPDAVCRADTAIDRGIRLTQRCSGGHPGRQPPAPPNGSGAYDKRYRGQALRIRAAYGRLDAAGVRAIAQAVAAGSNVQSVVYGYPDVWVANAEGMTPAAETAYHHYDASDLLGPPE